MGFWGVRNSKKSWARFKIFNIFQDNISKILELINYVTFGIRHLVSGDLWKLLWVKISEREIGWSHMKASSVVHKMLNIQKYTLNNFYYMEFYSHFSGVKFLRFQRACTRFQRSCGPLVGSSVLYLYLPITFPWPENPDNIIDTISSYHLTSTTAYQKNFFRTAQEWNSLPQFQSNKTKSKLVITMIKQSC